MFHSANRVTGTGACRKFDLTGPRLITLRTGRTRDHQGCYDRTSGMSGCLCHSVVSTGATPNTATAAPAIAAASPITTAGPDLSNSAPIPAPAINDRIEPRGRPTRGL